MERAKQVFVDVNSVVSGWRANLETMQIHVGDLAKLFRTIASFEFEGLNEEHRGRLKSLLNEADPDWACESIGETVKQILGDSKQMKTMLLELRDQLGH